LGGRATCSAITVSPIRSCWKCQGVARSQRVSAAVQVGLHGSNRTIDVGKMSGEHFASAGCDAMTTKAPTGDAKQRPPAMLMPSDVSSRVGFFDRFAGLTAQMASRAPFFAFCLLLVLVWLIQGAIEIIAHGKLSAFLDGQYQLEINTTTTIITFLMVALLQNSQTRSDQAVQHKLNAIADGLADLMDHLSEQNDDDRLRADIRELRLAVGLEKIESTGTAHSSGNDTPQSSS
jgi:Low affinity iron permease